MYERQAKPAFFALWDGQMFNQVLGEQQVKAILCGNVEARSISRDIALTCWIEDDDAPNAVQGDAQFALAKRQYPERRRG